jgi:hypothetical protein
VSAVANLYFPQLSSGALAQYPIKKSRLVRTVKNLLADGSVVAFPDAGASRMVWELAYSGLTTADLSALKTHFSNCAGRLRSFTFLDPTENLLASSSDIRQQPWMVSSSIAIAPGAVGPDGFVSAFTAINNGGADQEIAQTLPIPASYNYSFSVFCFSRDTQPVRLIRRGPSVESSTEAILAGQWTRVVSSGILDDGGENFTVALSLAPGQEVCLYGPQLEAQPFPSPYRSTSQRSGVYTKAFWAEDQLAVAAESPDLFSTYFSIEAAV